MKLTNSLVANVLVIFMVILAICGTVFAPHDNGQGRSQDHDPYKDASSISATPEPGTSLLFIAGAGLVALRLRNRRSRD